MEKPISNYDFSDFSMIDLKTLLFKVLSYWKLFLLSFIIAFFITQYINASRQRIYSLESMITVKDEQNPIFGSNTNIAFNWGGASDQVETVKTILQSRTHNEKVVTESQFYIDYLKKGKYRLEDVYGQVPFHIKVNTHSYQLINTLIKIKFINEQKVEISFEVKDESELKLLNFKDFKTMSYSLGKDNFKKQFSVGNIETGFMNFDIEVFGKPSIDEEYYIRFNDFNSVVDKFKAIKVSTFKNGTSLLNLKLDGPNKNRLVDYLNASVAVLEKDQIESKIKYAVKTKAYIDTLFLAMAADLNTIESDLGNFKQKENIYNLSVEGSAIFENMVDLDMQTKHFRDRINYYERMESYLKNNDSPNENNIPVPAVIGVEDQNIATGIGILIAKNKTRENLLQTVTEDYPLVKQLNKEISMEKNALLENISNLKNETKTNLSVNSGRLNNSQSALKRLPEKEQRLLSFERKYAITEENYNYLKQKSYEAGTAIASNVSDIKIIDRAKDTGQVPFKPNTGFNTLIGFLLAIILPLIYILIKEYFNTKIHTVEEVENLYKIPILGLIGNNDLDTNIVVFKHPNSIISESYRSLRSNVQFLLNRNEKSHIILVTSSISGEGKTVTSINLASVFALSGKKTIVVGTDLRKPKLANEFNLNHNFGMTHYLIGEKTVDEVIQKTEFDNLYLLLSGTIPPNPSELLLSDATTQLMNYLKDNFDYIILDAPPFGIVSDAQELFKFAEIILYIVRQGYTEKGMLKQIEKKNERGEIAKVSLVLNDFTFNKRHGYGNGYGYGYDYGYGGYGNDKKQKKSNFLNKLFKGFFS
jgi:capsular exopolysaccharide synthesis family protein